MPNKDFVLDGDIALTIYKRRTSRNLRLSISPLGEVRVSIPAWAPYKTGLEFARSRQAWIRNQQQPLAILTPNQPIGKAHHLVFVAKATSTKVTSRVQASQIVVSRPAALAVSAHEVQVVAKKACIRALRVQAEQLLPQRLATLAATHGFVYRNVTIKQLKSRWGSCDQEAHIVLNLFLMQLPWELIDYVLIHELTHTKVLRHGPDFWQTMKKVLPNVTQLRKAIGEYHPVLS